MLAAQVRTRLAFRDILYCTDFSDASEAALPFVKALAREYGATIHALHVRTLNPGWAIGGAPLAQVMITEQELAQRDADRLHVLLAAFPHDVSVSEGDIWAPLADMLEKHSIDLIVLGTHGRTGIGKFVLGSIAAEIFRNVNCPVLTVGPHALDGYKKHTEFKDILFSTDFGDASLAALPYAISLAQENDARLTLVTVLDGPAIGDFITPELVMEAAKRRLLALIPPGSDLRNPPEAYVAIGKPADRIVAIAAERKADLVVLGAKEASTKLGRATHAGRAVAQEIAAKAPCPVLTVKLTDKTAVLTPALINERIKACNQTCESCG